MQDPEPRLSEYSTRALSYVEEEEAEEMATAARQQALAAISNSVRAMARESVMGARESNSAAEQVQKIRMATSAAIDHDLIAVAANISHALEEALVEGYRTHLYGYDSVMGELNEEWEGDPLVSPDDEIVVKSLPILGRTVRELTNMLAGQLHWDIDGALGLAATSQVSLDQLPTKLDDIAGQHGNRVADAVRGAHSTGCAAAALEWRQFLRGIALDNDLEREA